MMLTMSVVTSAINGYIEPVLKYLKVNTKKCRNTPPFCTSKKEVWLCNPCLYFQFSSLTDKKLHLLFVSENELSSNPDINKYKTSCFVLVLYSHYCMIMIYKKKVLIQISIVVFVQIYPPKLTKVNLSFSTHQQIQMEMKKPL